MKILIIIIFISICYNSLSQEINEENLLYKKEFEKILDEVLKDTLITNEVIDSKRIENNSALTNKIFTKINTKDSVTVLKSIEKILFEIYGEEIIKKQQPYNILLIKDYWVVQGTISNEYEGGTFLIIVKNKTGKIITLTHGK